ncbi:hypothetical protein BUALT_Bualt06G0128300 [Buddleja alternifolia]|uniref:DUF7610 domain-containing protein n=1 Tax=Buddleja alternifolia TaxID=168488 RepID=A0AAV6XJ26_9LAMI|nr:hypothetical protein BUALT_Bualt06G0128300 [Buddleja alternifolia]
MASRSSSSVVLQKKLHELESELFDVFRFPLDPTTSDPRYQMSFDDIKQRFSFLNSLLAAEVASQPENSDQFHEIESRLAALKTAFRDWNAYRSNCASNNLDDSRSVCSDCTETLRNDDVRGQSESPVSKPENFSGESSPEKFSDCVDVKDEDVKKEAAATAAGRIWGRIVKYSGVFGCGMIFGAICVVKLFSSSSDYLIQYEVSFLPPT